MEGGPGWTIAWPVILAGGGRGGRRWLREVARGRSGLVSRGDVARMRSRRSRPPL